MSKKYIFAGIATLALVIAGVVVFGGSSSPSGGTTSYQRQSFLEGFWAGTGRQLNVSRAGVITSSAGATFTTGTFSGDLTINTSDFFVDVSADEIGVGTTSPAQGFHLEQEALAGSVATTTLTISSASTSPAVGGQIIVEDTDGAGCTAIYALNGTVIGETVTCPTGI